MEKAKVLFESYNHVIEQGYDRIFEENKGDDLLKLHEEEIDKLLEGRLKAWEVTPITGLDDLAPKDYFDGLDDLDTIMELFVQGAKICDRDLPGLFVEKLKSFSEEAVRRLLGLAGDFSLIDSSEDYYIPFIAVRTLGKLKAEQAVMPLLNLIYRLNEERESLVEEIADALVDIGKAVIPPIIEIIRDSKTIGYIDEYVLNTLVRVGKINRSDEIFRSIKEAFFKMEDKILGALCLDDYGDGKAIPALRGYVEKNRTSIDKAVFLEICAAIKRLGGNVDDLI